MVLGHSRTIVGIEEKKNRSLCLLLFDPGCSSQQMQKLLKQNSDGAGLRLLRKFVGNLKEKQYQTVAVDGVLSLEEKAVSISENSFYLWAFKTICISSLNAYAYRLHAGFFASLHFPWFLSLLLSAYIIPEYQNQNHFAYKWLMQMTTSRSCIEAFSHLLMLIRLF